MSMQNFHTQLFVGAAQTAHWRGLAQLTQKSRPAFSKLALFWISW